MALTDVVNVNLLNEVVNELSGMLSGGGFIDINIPPNFPLGIKLFETFAVYTARVDAIAAVASAGGDLLDAAVSTHRLHHQVRSGPLRAFVRSVDDIHNIDATEPIVRMFSTASLASEIDTAIQWIDGYDPNDHLLVRVLFLPSYHLHAMWLINQAAHTSEVYVLTASKHLGIAPGTLMPSSQLLQILAAKSPVSGVIRP
jgi:hypothetical protein